MRSRRRSRKNFAVKTANKNAYHKRNAPTELGPTSKANKHPAKMAKLEQAYLSRKEALTNEEAEYLRCLLRPDLYTAKIPSAMPVPTHVSQTKGVLYRSTNDNGCLVVSLRPQYDNQMLCIVDEANLNETYPHLGQLTNAMIAQSSIENHAQSRRVVGAYLEVIALEPALNRKGVLTLANIPFDVLSATQGWSYDGIRDQPTARTVNVAETPRAAAVYTPLDPSALVFTWPSTAVGTGYPGVVALIAGAGKNANFAIKFRVVHEVIPSSTYTDLLVPTVGPRGAPEKAVQAANKMVDPSALIQQGIALAGGAGAVANIVGPAITSYLMKPFMGKVREYTNGIVI